MAELDTLGTFPSGMQVLVCAPPTADRDATTAALRECSYEVSVCDDVKQLKAIAPEKGIGWTLDLLVLEVALALEKDESGEAALVSINQMCTCPIVVLADEADRGVIVKCITLGAAEVLQKPMAAFVAGKIWQHCVRKRVKHEVREVAATSGEGSTAVGIEWRGGTCELEGGSSVGDCSGQGSGRSSQDESGLHVVQAVTGSAVQHAVLAKFQQPLTLPQNTGVSTSDGFGDDQTMVDCLLWDKLIDSTGDGVQPTGSQALFADGFKAGNSHTAAGVPPSDTVDWTVRASKVPATGDRGSAGLISSVPANSPSNSPRHRLTPASSSRETSMEEPHPRLLLARNLHGGTSKRNASLSKIKQRSFSWSARDRPLAVRPARQNSGLWPGAPSGMPVPALALGPHTLVPVWGTIMDGAPPYPNGFGQPYPAESPGGPGPPMLYLPGELQQPMMDAGFNYPPLISHKSASTVRLELSDLTEFSNSAVLRKTSSLGPLGLVLRKSSSLADLISGQITRNHSSRS